MSQPSIASFYHSRKRRASEELTNKSKVQAIETNRKKEIFSSIPEEECQKSFNVSEVHSKTQIKLETKSPVVRKLFDHGLDTIAKSKPVRRRTQSKLDNRQTDIRDSLFKNNDHSESKSPVCAILKFGLLSPKKNKVYNNLTPGSQTDISKVNKFDVPIISVNQETEIQKTPSKHSKAENNLPLEEIQKKIKTSSRLDLLREKIESLRKYDDKLKKLDEKRESTAKLKNLEEKRVKIKKFDNLELEIPVSPQKNYQSPSKILTPNKNTHISQKASPQRNLLLSPKQIPASPVKCSPIKAPAYQRYQSLLTSDEKKDLRLPNHYSILAEFFRCVETVSAMLFNRKEIITFNKLKPAVQELVRKDFTLNHLAQIKTVYPEAYSFHQEKIKSFASFQSEKYELVILPLLGYNSETSGRNTPDEDNVLKSALKTNMSPNVVLERRKHFNDNLIDIVKNQHEQFLLSMDPPVRLPKEKICRWHPEFPIETCKDIEKSELPTPPNQEKNMSAQSVLKKAKELQNESSRINKAIQCLADKKLNSPFNTESEDVKKINASIVDTPPPTPTSNKLPANSGLLKGIPPALLEKVRARQAAKALELMTRSSESKKDALIHSRFPGLAKQLRNIFVSENKNVLQMDFIIEKLNNSYGIKLSSNEYIEHIRLICKILPLWANIYNVRNVEHLKIDKNYDMSKVVRRLEVIANEKAA